MYRRDCWLLAGGAWTLLAVAGVPACSSESTRKQTDTNDNGGSGARSGSSSGRSGSSGQSDHSGDGGDGSGQSGQSGSTGRSGQTSGASGSAGRSGRSGGSSGKSGTSGDEGGSGSQSGSTGAGGPGSYALDPPKQCYNQFWVEGCKQGDTSSACGGQCQSANACEAGKPGPESFLCPRFTLFSQEMTQAAKDDAKAFGWSEDDPPFHYAIVGHDLDQGGLDDNPATTCCQCYQLVLDLPEKQAQDQATGKPAVPVPKPLIVQSFNTAAGGGKNFDVYMGAGGFGAFNACSPDFSMKSASGKYLYTAFPDDGEPSSGGVKAAGIYSECKTQHNLVTTETVSSAACQDKVKAACSKIAATSESVTQSTQDSCVKSNAPDSLYHQNWEVYAKRVACPKALTEVTGCKLVETATPAPDPKVITAEQAKADPSFKSGYHTTTMQDCCKPSCAWQDWVTGKGLKVEGQYNSFYSCDANGVPFTE